MRFDALLGPAFQDNPAAGLTRGDEQNPLLPILAHGQRQGSILLAWPRSEADFQRRARDYQEGAELIRQLLACGNGQSEGSTEVGLDP
jgi:hypothetical protein